MIINMISQGGGSAPTQTDSILLQPSNSSYVQTDPLVFEGLKGEPIAFAIALCAKDDATGQLQPYYSESSTPVMISMVYDGTNTGFSATLKNQNYPLRLYGNDYIGSKPSFVYSSGTLTVSRGGFKFFGKSESNLRYKLLYVY